MPYITQEAREELEVRSPENSGELNYLITSLIDDYLEDNGLCYKSINDIVGALECAKLELYRRVAAPYEDKKIDSNGDVYSEEHLE